MNDPLDGAIKRLNEFHAMAKTPLLVTIDGEWGLSMRFDEIPVFPRQMQLGALSSDSLVYEVGKAFGEECNKLNIHVDFAPDIDINNNINNPVINTRSFGEDRKKVAKYGIALSKGMASMNVAGSAKHFPGHGDTDVDSHKGLPVLNFTKSRLDSLELYPFRQLIANGVDMVMVGHLELQQKLVNEFSDSKQNKLTAGCYKHPKVEQRKEEDGRSEDAILIVVCIIMALSFLLCVLFCQ